MLTKMQRVTFCQNSTENAKEEDLVRIALIIFNSNFPFTSEIQCKINIEICRKMDKFPRDSDGIIMLIFVQNCTNFLKILTNSNNFPRNDSIKILSEF